MKTACVYHSIDLDGWMSAAIVKHWYKLKYKGNTLHHGNIIVDPNEGLHSLEFIGYNYGQPIPDLLGYDKVIMCDISFPSEEMLKLEKRLDDNFIWMDHHYGAFETMKKDIVDYTLHPFRGLQDTKFAACELTWLYFMGNQEEINLPQDINEIPEIVRLLGRYDCFGHKGTNEETKVLEFQYGARQCISNYEEAFESLSLSLRANDGGDYIIKPILESGKSIYQYLCTDAKQSYKNGFEVVLKFYRQPHQTFTSGDKPILQQGYDKYRFICFNKERFNPINFGINYHKDNYCGAMCFHYANGKWNFSLYNDNGEVDCSIIAKQFGGGHKGASGFVVDDLKTVIG